MVLLIHHSKYYTLDAACSCYNFCGFSAHREVEQLRVELQKNLHCSQSASDSVRIVGNTLE